MRARRWLGALIGSAALLSSNSASAAECPSELSGSPPVQEILDCINEHKREIADLKQGAAGRPAIPSGAVMAFDRSTGCPDGWTDMGEDWSGRVLVAAVADPNKKYGFGRRGGAEVHKLTVAEMPVHSHQLIMVGPLAAGGASGAVQWYDQDFATPERVKQTGREGGAEPHNNMPPYIALYFCKKD